MELFDRLWPIPRSLTGNGVRATLKVLGEEVPIRRLEVPSGTRAFDWTVPKEWNIRDAYVKDSSGKKLINFKKNNLHVLGYSVPVHAKISKKELMKHVHTLPSMPRAIPYLTSYYQERWGFCVEQRRLSEFRDKRYEVVIDSTLKKGHLTIGEGFIKGRTNNEILLSTYICHPSMANNELSGPIVQTLIYKHLLKRKRNLKYSYRFLYLPETIGAIVYLSRYGRRMKKKVKAGYVITCVGDDAPFTYKKSRRGDSLADRAALNVLRASSKPYRVVDWFPSGSDERQYGSPGFDLPVGSLMRSMYGTYKEYHTSLDNRSFIKEKAIAESAQTYLNIIEGLEVNDVYINQHPNCEPQLGKRGLYPTLGSQREIDGSVKKIMWLLGFGDGKHDVLDIADKLALPAASLKPEVELLLKEGLLKLRKPSRAQ